MSTDLPNANLEREDMRKASLTIIYIFQIWTSIMMWCLLEEIILYCKDGNVEVQLATNRTIKPLDTESKVSNNDWVEKMEETCSVLCPTVGPGQDHIMSTWSLHFFLAPGRVDYACLFNLVVFVFGQRRKNTKKPWHLWQRWRNVLSWQNLCWRLHCNIKGAKAKHYRVPFYLLGTCFQIPW